MMEKNYSRILLVLIILTITLLAIILLATNNSNIENPQTCNLCHEMEPYVTSYLKPNQGSAIEKHKLTCIECHTNTSPEEANAAILKEIELSALSKLTGIELNTRFPALAANCTRCHIMQDFRHLNATYRTNCQNCHWAHRPLNKTEATSLFPVIPYGPHRNQSCEKCHGITFQIPRCINCHAGHGEQKLENYLCLECHTDPHIPKKPGIRSNNTVNFTANLSLSVCQPCHEKEYFEIISSGSKHAEMQTCALCHKSHGEKPRCNKCHPVMQEQKHPDFVCENCHATFSRPIKITCYDCHGKSHEWSAFTAVWNPK